MKKLINAVKRHYRALAAAAYSLYIALLNTPRAFASDIASSKVAMGTEKLIGDLTTWLLILAPLAGIACVIYFAVRRSMADEQEQKQWDNRIKTAIISVIIAVVASGIIKIIIGYYQ